VKLHELWKDSYKNLLHEYKSPEEAVKGSHAIIILTEWDIFRTYDYSEYYKLMEKPSYIFDGRNLLVEEDIKKIGFTYHRVGKKFTH
jgi:UDPglucose 6-dehydrogenase